MNKYTEAYQWMLRLVCYCKLFPCYVSRTYGKYDDKEIRNWRLTERALYGTLCNSDKVRRCDNERYDVGNLRIGYSGSDRWNQHTWRARIFSDDHELQRDTTEKTHRNYLPCEMCRGRKRTGVRRYLHHPNAGSRLPGRKLSFSVGM